MKHKIFTGYDIWFGKVNLPDDRALWFRYTNFLSRTRPQATEFESEQKLITGASSRDFTGTGSAGSKKNETHVWAIFFEKEKNLTAKIATNEISVVSESKEFILFWNDKNNLSTNRVIGETGRINWDLHFENSGKSHVFIPPILGKLGLVKSRYDNQFQDVCFSGEIVVQGEILSVKNQLGMMGHITGDKQAHDWAWVHCNEFDTHPNVVFEGLAVRLKIAGGIRGPFSIYVLYYEGEKYVFDNLQTFFLPKTSLENSEFRFSARKKHLVLNGKVFFDRFQPVVVEYHDTDMSKLYCRNSKRATLELELKDLKQNTSVILTSKSKVAYEIVDRHLPDKIDL